jgi:hypothetical protein
MCWTHSHNPKTRSPHRSIGTTPFRLSLSLLLLTHCFCLRLYQYFPVGLASDRPPCAAHADLGILTVAPAATERGLIYQRLYDMEV